MSSVRMLQRWLVVVAALRMLSVVIGVLNPDKFKTAVFDKQPELVNDLLGRLFACWTIITCSLCLTCARNPSSKPVYGATLFSFVVALVFFLSELLIFKTLSMKGAASPMAVAGISTLWMGAGWNYYTKYSKEDDHKSS